MTDATPSTDNANKDAAMSDSKKTKTKKTKPAASKAKTNGHSNGASAAVKLDSLNRGPARTVQETFRATPDEHNKLVASAKKAGFTSMSDYYRSTLGLDAAG